MGAPSIAGLANYQLLVQSFKERVADRDVVIQLGDASLSSDPQLDQIIDHVSHFPLRIWPAACGGQPHHWPIQKKLSSTASVRMVISSCSSTLPRASIDDLGNRCLQLEVIIGIDALVHTL